MASIRSCPSQAPQSAHRENDGDQRGHAERDDRPDEEEGSAGLGDFAADTLPHHVEDGDGQPEERPEPHGLKTDRVPLLDLTVTFVYAIKRPLCPETWLRAAKYEALGVLSANRRLSTDHAVKS
jgi:hypothetical protein